MNERFILTAPEPEDLDFMFRIENDPSVWPVTGNHMPYSRYALKQYIASCPEDFFTAHQARFMVRREGERQAVAIADLFDYSPTDSRAELGLVVDPALRGQNVGPRALETLSDYAFRMLGLQRLVATVPMNNTGCLRMFAKTNFQQVAVLPEWVKMDGKWVDLVVFLKKV